jgi:hypothetical protein
VRAAGWQLAASVAILILGSGAATAATKIELLVIGNNQPPAGAGLESSLPRLRFADDDAAAFFDLLEGTAEAGHLLTVMDGDTQALYPRLVARSRPPTLAELRAAVADLGGRIAENRRRRDDTVVYVFFSGHGTRGTETGAALALLDGGITQQVLYDEILEKLPADYVHLFVDACHAEAVVRPRDLDAQAVPVERPEANAFLMRSTLARFPQVGAIVAAASDAQAHEWDVFQQGVFSHEILSALRGAADVNHDGRVEYSEIYAFLGSANRSIHDPRARLSVVARPPERDRHVAVVDLIQLSPLRTARLAAVPAQAGLVEVEDGAGHRIATMRGEQGYLADLVVPSSQPVYVRANGKEAMMDARPGQVVAFGTLKFRGSSSRPRGALEDAVRTGLFASEFGRGYYTGFIDQSSDFAPVSFGQERVARADSEADLTVTMSPRSSGAAWKPASRLLMGGGVATTIADGLGPATAVRVSTHQTSDRGLALAFDFAESRADGVSEWRAALSAGWLWSRALGPGRGWLGAMAGAGLIEQSAVGRSGRSSETIALSPTAGLALDFTPRVGVWSEVLLSGMVCRRDAEEAFVFVPSVFAGASVAF